MFNYSKTNIWGERVTLFTVTRTNSVIDGKAHKTEQNSQWQQMFQACHMWPWSLSQTSGSHGQKTRRFDACRWREAEKQQPLSVGSSISMKLPHVELTPLWDMNCRKWVENWVWVFSALCLWRMKSAAGDCQSQTWLQENLPSVQEEAVEQQRSSVSSHPQKALETCRLSRLTSSVGISYVYSSSFWTWNICILFILFTRHQHAHSIAVNSPARCNLCCSHGVALTFSRGF